MVRVLHDGRELFVSDNSLEFEFMDIVYAFAKFRNRHPADMNPFILRIHCPNMQFQIMETILGYCATYANQPGKESTILHVDISHILSIPALHSLLIHKNIELHGSSNSFIHSYYSNSPTMINDNLYIRIANSAILHGLAIITKQAYANEDIPKQKTVQTELMKYGEILIPYSGLKELSLIIMHEIEEFKLGKQPFHSFD